MISPLSGISCSVIVLLSCVNGVWMESDFVQQPNDTTQQQQQLTEQPCVDILASDYFKIEQNLWTMIENRADNVLLHVFRTHERFFNQTISESASGVLALDLVPNMDDVVQLAVNVNATAEQGYNHLREQDVERKSITDYANSSLRILKSASDLYDMVMKPNLWENILNHLNGCHRHGETVQSSHQVMFDFYRDIQSGLLKSYVTSQMSYMILAYYDNSKSYREESDILRSTFEARFEDIREMAKNHLPLSQRQVWKCDATMAKDDENQWYAEVTNFLQGIVDNEANLNADGSCASICPAYRETYHYQCQSGSLCDASVNAYKATKCDGTMRHCQEIDDSDVNICEIDGPNRHYNFIKYSDGRTAGYANTMCRGRLTAQSWIRWFVKCGNCFCMCDKVADRVSDRYFSLREVVSDIGDNKIVTGVTLAKLNGIFHLMISERNLLPFGQAEVTPPYPYGDTWRAADNIFDDTPTTAGAQANHFTLTYANRSINLNYVTVPKDHLVTGVRFRIIDGHISLEIRATEFEFTTGRLKNRANSLWVSNPNCGQTKIELTKRNNPAMSKSDLSVPNTTPNAYIEFGPTDYWSDVSQLTVPFIDTQRVEPYRPIALAGVGLYHKTTTKGSGGFIATKLIVYDFTPYIQAN